MATEIVKVIARFQNGRLIKGFTRNFFPNKDLFHISPPDSPYGVGTGILMKELKAVFFVRDFTGNPGYGERKSYSRAERPLGKPMEITFLDGEVLVGSTLGYNPDRPGFFIAPADPQSNNLRIYAITSAVERVRRI